MIMLLKLVYIILCHQLYKLVGTNYYKAAGTRLVRGAQQVRCRDQADRFFPQQYRWVRCSESRALKYSSLRYCQWCVQGLLAQRIGDPSSRVHYQFTNPRIQLPSKCKLLRAGTHR